MAMIDCHECGESISGTAKRCPKCGCDFYWNDANETASKLLWVILPIVGAGLIYVVFFLK